ncbi:MAG: glutathione S-transferase [Alphaproteobacteria bacterium]|nr:glutathione S-transferase [Alphaproteobacteria bacterium]
MAYTLVIGTRNWSSWSLRPYVALRAAGVPFETVVIRLREKQHPTTRDQILPWSPAGKVPVLKIEEGGETITVWDSLAICETIAERHPGAGLLPADPRARALMRAYACEMHSGFADVRDQLGMEFARTLPLPELRDDTRDQVARIIASWEDALATWKGEFLFGAFSVADCMYAPVVSRFVTYGVAVPPPVQGYMERVMALPSMQAWMADSRAEVEAGLDR